MRVSLDGKKNFRRIIGFTFRDERAGVVSTHVYVFFFSSRRRHTRFDCDWSSDVCSSDLYQEEAIVGTFDAWKMSASVLGCMPTGTGKTIVAGEAIRRGGGRAMVLCHTGRSEERRVGKEGRSRWSPYH